MRIYLNFLFLILPILLNGQTGLEGHIVDQYGVPLSYATVFVLETKQGTASNPDGQYFVPLAPGTYQVKFQFLGYTSQQQQVVIGRNTETLDITLIEETIQLETIEIIDNREDPAYTIMRRAIAKAKYHTQQIDAYTAKSYIKGSGRIINVPMLFRKRLEKALAEEGIDSTAAFTSESVSEISYQRPNQFSEKVISIRTSGDDNNTSPNQFINGSFYEPKIASAISPLSPQAFAYYRFEYLGFFADYGYNINKIKITPRSKGDQVFEGVIYIVDNLWTIHSLALSMEYWGIRFGVNQVFVPIQENVWLPVNHTYDADGKVFGFEFKYQYYANISDYQITLNHDLPDEILLYDEKIEEKKERTQKVKLEKDDPLARLATGEELSRKELRKALRTYEKEESKSSAKVLGDSSNVDLYKVTHFEVDSNAYIRNEGYWDTLRPIPLTAYEVKGYRILDSLSRNTSNDNEGEEGDTIVLSIGMDGASTEVKKNDGFDFSSLILGTNNHHKKGWSYGWKSPLLNTHFNTVEGINIAIPFHLKKSAWSLSPTLHYSFARKRFNGKIESTWSFGEKNKSWEISVEGGRFTSGYNPAAINAFVNDFYTLFLERNYLKTFEQKYLEFSLVKELNSKNQLSLSYLNSQRLGLANNVAKGLINRDGLEFSSNFPNNIAGFRDFNKSSISQIGMSYTTRPWLKFQEKNGIVSPIPGTSPTFQILYRGALGNDDYAAFHHIDFCIKHQWEWGVRGDLNINLNSGFFTNTKNMTIVDLKHFPGNQTIFTTSDPAASFRLLPYYEYSENKNYLALYSNYLYRKFLLTRIPVVRLTGIREATFANYLKTSHSPHYVEVGYTLNLSIPSIQSRSCC